MTICGRNTENIGFSSRTEGGEITAGSCAALPATLMVM